MPKAVLLVFSDPSSPEVESAYNSWYDSSHLPDVFKAAPGIKAATRYRLVGSPPPGVDMPNRHMAIYEVEADDLNEILEGLGAAHGRGELPLSDTLQVGPLVFLEQVSERQTGEAG